MSTRQTKKTRPKVRDDAATMAKALSHPLRAAMLVELSKRTASPADLARLLEVPVENVAYHVKKLVELHCIELVSTRPRRGAIEHFYRSTRRTEITDEAYETMTPVARRHLALEWFRRAFTDVHQAIDAGTVADTPDVHLSLTSFELDDAAWADVTARLEAVVEHALALQAEQLEGERRPGRLVMGLFEPAPARTPPSPPAG